MFFLLNFAFFFLLGLYNIYVHLPCMHSLIIRKMCVYYICVYGKTNIMSNKKLCWKIIIMRWVCAYFFLFHFYYTYCIMCVCSPSEYERPSFCLGLALKEKTMWIYEGLWKRNKAMLPFLVCATKEKSAVVYLVN